MSFYWLSHCSSFSNNSNKKKTSRTIMMSCTWEIYRSFFFVLLEKFFLSVSSIWSVTFFIKEIHVYLHWYQDKSLNPYLMRFWGENHFRCLSEARENRILCDRIFSNNIFCSEVHNFQSNQITFEKEKKIKTKIVEILLVCSGKRIGSKLHEKKT